MPDWDEINKRLREAEPEEEKMLPGDTRPGKEYWSAQTDRLQREREAKEKARRNEPGMLKVGFTLTFEQVGRFGTWLKNKLKK